MPINFIVLQTISIAKKAVIQLVSRTQFQEPLILPKRTSLIAELLTETDG